MKESESQQSDGDGPPGDPGGRFESLYEQVAPALYSWATLRIRSSIRSQLDPEDVVQEVWWRALDGYSKFDPVKGTFRSWIFGIATRVLLNAFRSLRVRGSMPDDERDGPRREALPSSLADQATSISQRAARADLTRKVLAYVAELDESDRELFAFCALEGLSVPQAATIMRVPTATAAKRWQRLRARLRQATFARQIMGM